MRKTPKLGQHLLTNPRVCAVVADAAGVGAGTRVLEVGPGKGILTSELLTRGASVVAIEKDPAMVQILEERFSNELNRGALILIEGDVREVLQSTVVESPYVVAANIPYYITGELIRLFLTAPTQPTALALLVQKEVAERIARSKKESILSLSVQAYGTPRYIETVKRGNFNPPPKVDSAVLAITDISRKHFAKVAETDFFQVIKAGFGQKRKTLRGNLGRVFGRMRVEAVFLDLKIPPQVRAEDISLDIWLKLAVLLA